MKLKLFAFLATAALGAGSAYAQNQDQGKPDTLGDKADKAGSDVKSGVKSGAQDIKKGANDLKQDIKSDFSKSDLNKTDISKTSGKTAPTNHQLALVDLYLNQAIDSAKVLSTVADQQLAKSDVTVLNEAKTQLDAQIGKALDHVNKMNGANKSNTTAMGSSTASGAQDQTARTAELTQALKDARMSAKKLDLSKAGGTQAVDDVGSHLMSAQNALRDIAKQSNYTMLSDVKLGTVPVRGTDQGMGHDDLNKGSDTKGIDKSMDKGMDKSMDKSGGHHDMNKSDTNKSDLNKDINNQDLNKDINKDVNKDLNKTDPGSSKDVNRPGGTTY